MSLGMVAFIYLGWMFGHLGFLANTPNAYGYLCYVIFATEVNDVAAFTFGKMFGRHPLRSEISPRKTWEGALGALVVSLALPWLLRFSFPFFGPWQLILAGLIVGIGGQLGDLSFSVIKRDLGAKDMGATHPGPWRYARSHRQPDFCRAAVHAHDGILLSLAMTKLAQGALLTLGAQGGRAPAAFSARAGPIRLRFARDRCAPDSRLCCASIAVSKLSERNICLTTTNRSSWWQTTRAISTASASSRPCRCGVFIAPFRWRRRIIFFAACRGPGLRRW